MTRPPFDNADRLAYVMVTGKTQADAEQVAENFVSNTRVELLLPDAQTLINQASDIQ